MKTFYGIELFGEPSDSPPNVDNAVIIDEYDVARMIEKATFSEWRKIILFPSKEHAEYFVYHFNNNKVDDYTESMMSGEYYVHILNPKYPKPEKLYADQIKVNK